ncbi:twin-arginine translocase TatA/TatE family subunit [bacterium]|nr:twin-arginine translocase TatA/TatE family subunit [bacterium]|tara:strand:+ start:948 stop:1154 length:207 start_codon:yes stop_codon:yes gene_type:complete
MFGLGFSEIVLVLVIFILLFGPKEIPVISKKLAKFYRDVLKVKDDFNDSVNNEINDLKKIKKDIEDKD